MGKKKFSFRGNITLVLIVVVAGTIGYMYVLRNDVGEFGRAADIYQKQCASCHGAEGLGDGEVAYMLFPRPRDFSLGRFRLVTTEKGIPNKDDLFNTISRGMPGSAMPPWEHISEEDRWELVDYIRKLTYDGMVARRSEDVMEEDLPGVHEWVINRLVPEASFEISEEIDFTPELLKQGEDFYVQGCAGCHGLSGKGDGNSNTRDEEGYLLAPNDFTKGIFKGSGSLKDIAYRIRLGMPGSAMPSFDYGNNENLLVIAQYVRSFIPEDAEQRTTQHRQSIHVNDVGISIDLDPLSPFWDNYDPTYVALMPLWMQNEKYIDGVQVRVVYTDEHVAFHLTWKDSSRNEGVEHSVDTFTDGAAIQFSDEEDPPFFAMGDLDDPVNIWLWKPDKAEDLNASGFGTLESQEKNEQNIETTAVWEDGVWHVVFRRSLASLSSTDVEFIPGQSVRVAFAVWDGDREDRDGQKSVTIWHDLIL
jgi:DMSO reductase family type II enzyme heme b subunit